MDSSKSNLTARVKLKISNKLKEYANKMGRDHLGGDDIPSNKKSGGLRDNDGYDNVQYNRDMPQDEQGVGTATVFLKNQEELDESVNETTLFYEFLLEGGLPQNWMAGRVSDYHTKLRGKKRDYDDTNFAKMNTGQPDMEDEELDPDNEVVNEKFDKVEHLSLLTKALKSMPGSQSQKEIIRQLNVVRKAGGMRPLKETAIEEYASRLTNAYILDDESVLDGTPEPKDTINRESATKKSEKNYKDWKNTNESVSTDAYTISRMMGTAQQSTQDFIDDNKIDVKKLKSYIKNLSPVKMIIFKDIVDGSTDNRLRNIKKRFIKQVKESVIDETAKRDYKDEYKKFQSSKKSKKYRAELNKYNRDKGTYGNGDGKDASHKGGKIVGFESEKKNRGRAEKSRLKKK